MFWVRNEKAAQNVRPVSSFCIPEGKKTELEMSTEKALVTERVRPST